MPHVWIDVDTLCEECCVLRVCQECGIMWDEHMDIVKHMSLTEGDCETIRSHHPK